MIETRVKSDYFAAPAHFAIERFDRVYVPHFGTFASPYDLFSYAFFLRDSMIANSHLAHLTDLSPAFEQLRRDNVMTGLINAGAEYSFARDEKPGLGLHELRFNVDANGILLPKKNQTLVRRLSKDWGGTPDYVRYHGSADSGPLIVNGILDIVDEDRTFLDKDYTRHDGKPMIVREGLKDFVSGIERQLNLFGNGFLENDRKNEKGHINPFRADDDMTFVHPSGELANPNMPKTSIELGGYTYDALIRSANLFMESEDPVERASAIRWFELAEKVQDSYLKLRNTETGYFAMGTDRNPITAVARPIKTDTAFPLLLLGSRIFDTLHIDDQRKCVDGLLETGFSDNLLNEAGFNSRSRKYNNLFRYADYWGEQTSWPVNAGDILLGLWGKGMIDLAKQVAIRVVNAENLGGVREFHPSLEDGTVVYKVHKTTERKDLHKWASTNYPEKGQTWSKTAGMLARYYLMVSEGVRSDPTSAFCEIEQQTLKNIPIEHLLNPRELQLKLKCSPEIVIDKDLGKALKEEAHIRHAATIPGKYTFTTLR